MASLHKYTVAESGNLGFGQAGSGHLDATESAAGLSGGIAVVAITMCENTTFTHLTQEDASYMGTGTSTHSHSIADSDVIASGITIFGRWSAVTVNTGSCIFYLG